MRTFWILKANHFGAKLKVFGSIAELEREIEKLQKYKDKSYEIIKVIEVTK